MDVAKVYFFPALEFSCRLQPPFTAHKLHLNEALSSLDLRYFMAINQYSNSRVRHFAKFTKKTDSAQLTKGNAYHTSSLKCPNYG